MILFDSSPDTVSDFGPVSSSISASAPSLDSIIRSAFIYDTVISRGSDMYEAGAYTGIKITQGRELRSPPLGGRAEDRHRGGLGGKLKTSRRLAAGGDTREDIVVERQRARNPSRRPYV
ncbi:hypothetical protein EVAR_56066_1 [Eumeta japonica]|uniref:Uncharacterized protein n=1 Tax=Eumeta variegata TaxID=151549 RepID=A0A4C1YMK2_EUMVA|nr:hypothetical protein EVAR_56066_1 [Eumeta japonica]